MDDIQIFIDSIQGYGPVVATGTIQGYPFYFYARWDGWCFTIGLGDAVDMQGVTQSSDQAFYRESDYGTPGGYEASYIPADDVRTRIEESAAEFVRIYQDRAQPSHRHLE